MNEHIEETPRPQTSEWIHEPARHRWVKYYGRHERGPVAAIVQESVTPAQRREASGFVVSVYRPGKGEGRIACRGNAPSRRDAWRMADAVLKAIAREDQ